MKKDNFLKVQEQGYKYATAIVLPPSDEWTKVPGVQKLSMLQVTPDSVVKTRKIGKHVVPYVSIDYIERALNFVSNFNWGIKVVDSGMKSYTRTTNKGKEMTVYDAWVLCDCYIVLDGNRIERSAYGAWQMHENPAISDWSVFEASRSMATKSFADTLGLGSDKLRAENKAVEKARQEIIEGGYTDEDVLSDVNGKNGDS